MSKRHHKKHSDDLVDALNSKTLEILKFFYEWSLIPPQLKKNIEIYFRKILSIFNCNAKDF